MAQYKFTKHADKVNFVYEMLMSDEPHHIIIIGQGASGKSFVMNEVHKKLLLTETDTAISYIVWNEGDAIVPLNNNHNVLCPNTLVCLRWEYDSMVRSLTEEYPGTVVVYFDPDPSYK